MYKSTVISKWMDGHSWNSSLESNWKLAKFISILAVFGGFWFLLLTNNKHSPICEHKHIKCSQLDLVYDGNKAIKINEINSIRIDKTQYEKKKTNYIESNMKKEQKTQMWSTIGKSCEQNIFVFWSRQALIQFIFQYYFFFHFFDSVSALSQSHTYTHARLSQTDTFVYPIIIIYSNGKFKREIKKAHWYENDGYFQFMVIFGSKLIFR